MTPCDHEQRVVEAVRAGRLMPEIEAHLASCAECREVAEAVRWMSTLAADTARLADRRRLAEAGQLWWKGQLARRWEAEARAVAPLDRMQRVEVLAGVIAARRPARQFLPDARRPRRRADPGSDFWPVLAGLASSSALTWIVVVVLGTAIASIVMLRRLLLEDCSAGAALQAAALRRQIRSVSPLADGSSEAARAARPRRSGPPVSLRHPV